MARRRRRSEEPSGSDLTRDRDYLDKRWNGLDTEYSSFRDHHRELAEFIEPRRGRWFVTDRNKGDKRWKVILNNRATIQLRRSAAGMLAGFMSPSRPWFGWRMRDDDLMRRHEVKVWLELYRKVILDIFNSSNLYNMASGMIKELLLFGTACMTHEDDFDDVARFYTHTCGSYRIGLNSKLQVGTLAREFQLTVYQLVQRFGLENVSPDVRSDWDRGNYNNWKDVRHLIEMNPFRDDTEARLSAEFLPFRSVYWQPKGDKSSFLRRSGHKGFPAYVPRWEVTGEDVWATNCPGMTILGDVKQLQTQERELGKMQAKAGAPPLQGPPSFQNRPISNLPGGVTIGTTSNAKLEPVYQVDPHEQGMQLGIEKTERRIDSGLYTDLFMAITEMEGIQPKNQLQLSQINEERLLMLGPALEQVHSEWLARMVSRTGQQVLEADIMPPAPEELEGRELEVEFVSALAMAQRAVATSAIERVVFFAGTLVEGGLDVTDKIDADFAVDEYAHLVGAPPKLIVPTEQARAQREQKMQARRMQEMLAQGQDAANIAKMTSDSKLSDDNVLSRATGGPSGEETA